MPAKRIYRNPKEKVIAGVCSGIAHYFDVDVAWVRLAFVLAIFASGFGILAYVVAWIVFPKDERVPGAPEVAVPASDQEQKAEKPRKVSSGASRNAAGIVLVLLGVLFFMDQNFWWFRFDAFWPVILIGLGVYLVMRPGAHSDSEVEPVAPMAAAQASGAPDAPTDHTLSS